MVERPEREVDDSESDSKEIVHELMERINIYHQEQIISRGRPLDDEEKNEQQLDNEKRKGERNRKKRKREDSTEEDTPAKRGIQRNGQRTHKQQLESDSKIETRASINISTSINETSSSTLHSTNQNRRPIATGITQLRPNHMIITNEDRLTLQNENENQVNIEEEMERDSPEADENPDIRREIREIIERQIAHPNPPRPRIMLNDPEYVLPTPQPPPIRYNVQIHRYTPMTPTQRIAIPTPIIHRELPPTRTLSPPNLIHERSYQLELQQQQLQQQQQNQRPSEWERFVRMSQSFRNHLREHYKLYRFLKSAKENNEPIDRNILENDYPHLADMDRETLFLCFLTDRDYDGMDYSHLSSLDETIETTGLSKEEQEQLETFEMKQALENVVETCRICMEPHLEKEILTKLPCKHMFHQQCFTKWIAEHETCPLCKTNMKMALKRKREHSLLEQENDPKKKKLNK